MKYESEEWHSVCTVHVTQYSYSTRMSPMLVADVLKCAATERWSSERSFSLVKTQFQSLHLPSPTEEIEKKLTSYRRGSKFWRMLIFCQVRKRRTKRQCCRNPSRMYECVTPLCRWRGGERAAVTCLCVPQGGPGHLYLLKNKVATFAKVEKEEDMSQ